MNDSFDPNRFRHHAFFNQAASRIEMHLVAQVPMQMTAAGKSFDFRRGESIHSESACKYSVPGFHSQARGAGFRPELVWTDEHDWFSAHHLAAPT